VELPSYEACRADPLALNRATLLAHQESSPGNGRPLAQAHGAQGVWVNPPSPALEPAELDKLYELPFAWAPHPGYGQAIPAFEAVRASLTVTRGCGGGCSFCAIALHQGRHVVSRSRQSVLREARALAARPGWRGVISDVGGPTANLYGMGCGSDRARAACRRLSCLQPRICRHFVRDHVPYRQLLRELRGQKGIQRVLVGSGLRHDLACEDPAFLGELARHHVSGRITVAPEHASPAVLRAMGKPPIERYQRFCAQWARAGQGAALLPYFLAAHPGAGPAEAVELALFLKREGIRPRQAQLFLPTPGTLATAMYVSGCDPRSGEPLPVARGAKERARHRALLFYWKREEAPAVREALQAWGRRDLIGRGPGCLAAPGPVRGGWLPRPEERRRGSRKE